ncbi:hypothetical protein Hanom_Chr12g01150211 [Helianthus anomalus]
MLKMKTSKQILNGVWNVSPPSSIEKPLNLSFKKDALRGGPQHPKLPFWHKNPYEVHWGVRLTYKPYLQLYFG